MTFSKDFCRRGSAPRPVERAAHIAAAARARRHIVAPPSASPLAWTTTSATARHPVVEAPGVSTGNAIYFRGELPSGFAPAVEGPCALRVVGPWSALSLPGVADGDQVARALSSQVEGPVLWMLVQTTASVVVVHHAEGGRTLRHIERGDGAWRRVEGASQPWEAWLFSPSLLDENLARVDEGEGDAVRATFARGTLAAGDVWPMPGEWETCWRALGVDAAEARAAWSAPPQGVVEGTRTSGVTLAQRAALLVGLGALGLTVASAGDARALLGALAVMSLVAALLLGAVRRVLVGRWLA